MAPAQSLARLRKYVLDRVARGEVSMTEAARQLGCSRSRLYELRVRYERYGEAGLLPKPRPAGRHPAALSPACRVVRVILSRDLRAQPLRAPQILPSGPDGADHWTPGAPPVSPFQPDRRVGVHGV